MYHDWMGGMWFGWILWIALFALVVWIVLKAPARRNGTSSMYESPIEILKRRYAAGEITKEEFERMKKEIE